MDFKEFYERLKKYSESKSWTDFKISNIIESQNKCDFHFSAGKGIFGEILLHQDGILELKATCKRSSESKGFLFNIATVKSSSVWIYFQEVHHHRRSEEQVYEIIRKAAIYLKREYKKNFN